MGHFRADLLVATGIIVEIKASERLAEADHKQLLNYLRCSKLEIGLLLHFGPKPSFRRIIHEARRKRDRLSAPFPADELSDISLRHEPG